MTTTVTAPSATTAKAGADKAPKKRVSAGRIAAWVAMALIMAFTLLPFY